MKAIWRYSKENQVSPRQVQILESYLLDIPTTEGYIRLDQIQGLFDSFARAVAEGNSEFLDKRRGYKVDRVADIIEVAESKEFFGLQGSLWPTTKEDLWRIFHSNPPPFEILLTGAAGTAKSTKSWIATGYTLYLLSCMWNPQLELEMAPIDEIFLIFQSMRLTTANLTLFERLKRAVDSSSWFTDHFQRNRKKNQVLEFANQVTVMPITGATDAALGLNVIGGVITEINFMPVHRKSVRLQYSDKEEFDVGAEMYRNLRNRIIGRFKSQIDDGDFIGRLIIDSARNHVNDFAATKIEEARHDPTILVISRALWEAKSHKYPPDAPKFPVELASDHRPARILQSIDLAEDPDNVVWIPEVFRKDCEQDLEQALKDLAGEPMTSTGRFIPFPAEIQAVQAAYVEKVGDDRSLFTVEESTLAEIMQTFATEDGVQQTRPEWSMILDYDYLEQLKLEGNFDFAVHVDTSLSGDATGIAVGRIIDSVLVEKGLFFSNQESRVREIQGVEAPVYQIDGVLRIYATSGRQIDLNLIRDLVLELNRHINIKYASADWLESAAMLQAWRSKRIVSGHVSVDKNPASYFELKHAIQDGRILLPPHSWLDKEIRRLKRILTGGSIKIDHEPNESKDCADAVAGVVGVLQRTHRYRRM